MMFPSTELIEKRRVKLGFSCRSYLSGKTLIFSCYSIREKPVSDHSDFAGSGSDLTARLVFLSKVILKFV